MVVVLIFIFMLHETVIVFFTGDRCHALTTQSVFERVLTAGDFGARASHTTTLVNDTQIWAIGGAHFTGVNNSFVAVYDTINSSWHGILTKNTPKSRYDHTIVRYKVNITIFGYEVLWILWRVQFYRVLITFPCSSFHVFCVDSFLEHYIHVWWRNWWANSD